MSHEYSGTRHNVQRRKAGPNRNGFPRSAKSHNGRVYDARAPQKSDVEASKRKRKTKRFHRGA
jgi:hypothetical protein